MPVADDSPVGTFYRVSAADLQPGDEDAGNWGPSLAVPCHDPGCLEPGYDGDTVQAYWFESVLEPVRAREFPHLPSRLDGVFVFESLDVARLFADSRGWHVYLVRGDVGAPHFRGDMGCLAWPNVGTFGEMDAIARGYWRGDPCGGPVEWLLTRPVVVVRTVARPAAR